MVTSSQIAYLDAERCYLSSKPQNQTVLSSFVFCCFHAAAAAAAGATAATAATVVASAATAAAAAAEAKVE